MKGATTISTFVPIVITKWYASGNQLATRAHLEFPNQQLPDERVMDGIVVCALVIQHTIILSHKSSDPLWWFPFNSLCISSY